MEALVIRPHGVDRIRRWMYSLLEEQGVRVRTTPDLAEGLTESNIVHALRPMRADLLVLPFQAGKTSGSRAEDGLSLLERIRREVAWARMTPTILHVGIFAYRAFQAAHAAKPHENLFVLFEDQLAAEATPSRIRAFLEEHAAQFRHFTGSAA